MNPYFHVTTVLTLEVIRVDIWSPSGDGGQSHHGYRYYIKDFEDIPKLKKGNYETRTVNIEVWALENIFKNAATLEDCAKDLWLFSIDKELAEQKNELLDRIYKAHVK